jgi:hypothetical protein
LFIGTILHTLFCSDALAWWSLEDVKLLMEKKLSVKKVISAHMFEIDDSSNNHLTSTRQLDKSHASQKQNPASLVSIRQVSHHLKRPTQARKYQRLLCF